MNRREKQDESTKYLGVLVDYLHTVTEISDQTRILLEDTDYGAMRAFKPYIGPQQNIRRLLDFYRLYEEAIASFNNIKIEFERIGWDEDKGEISMKDLESADVLQKIDALKQSCSSLSEYQKVKLVAEHAKTVSRYIEGLNKRIKRAFFASLASLPKIPSHARKYAQYLLKVIDNRELLGAYTKKVYNALGFFNIENNFDALIQQTTDLTSFFNLIININKELLGKQAAHNINVGLITLLMVNLKKIISDTLGVVDKDNKPEMIPYLIRLSGNLKHSEGPLIKEIEDLFVYKDSINKLILNCMIEYLSELELLERPNRHCKIEKVSKLLIKILGSFEQNPREKEKWAEKYGPSFGVYNAAELDSNFGTKCLMKVDEVAEKLDGMEKQIYLANNYYAFRSRIEEYKGREMKEQIEKAYKMITGLWKIGIDAASRYNTGEYIRKECMRQSRYYLPEELRNRVQEELKSIVEGLIINRTINENPDVLREAIEQVYTGSKN